MEIRHVEPNSFKTPIPKLHLCKVSLTRDAFGKIDFLFNTLSMTLNFALAVISEFPPVSL